MSLKLVKVTELTDIGATKYRQQPDLSGLEPAGGQELTGVPQGGRGLAASQHPGDFPLSVLALYLVDQSFYGIAALPAFGHDELSIGPGSHLRQMGDHNHLGGDGQSGQTTTQLHGSSTADACIHLVEDEGHRRSADLGIKASMSITRLVRS